MDCQGDYNSYLPQFLFFKKNVGGLRIEPKKLL